jgi:hypothetical protein
MIPEFIEDRFVYFPETEGFNLLDMDSQNNIFYPLKGLWVPPVIPVTNEVVNIYIS